jgi:hypothetical protein
MGAKVMTVVLNERNIVLVNSLRNAALKSSTDFNTLKFFADFEYAKASLSRFAKSGVPELANLAAKARDNLFEPASAAAPGAARTPAEEPKPAAPAVRLSPPQRYLAAKELMNGMVVDAVGLRSVFFVLQLECTAVAADLEALMPRFHKLIAKSVGDAVASIMVGQVRKVI